jgi:hypothetical protein
MAIAFEVVYEYTDDSGDKAESAIKLPTIFTLEQYTEFVRAMAVLVDKVVVGIVSRAGIRVAIDVSSLTDNTVLGLSDVEDVGAFQFATVDSRPVRVNIPGIQESLVLAGSDDIDTGAAPVAAFNTAMLSGIAVTAATIQPTDVAEDDIDSLVFARERFRSTS